MRRRAGMFLAGMFLAACIPCVVLAAAPPTSIERISGSSLRRTKIVNAVYPKFAIKNAMQGKVVMHFTVLPDGSTTDIEVVESDPVGIFDESAVHALSQWRYEPIVRNGKAVSQPTTVTVRFAL